MRQNPLPSTAVSTYVHAPDTAVFMHTSRDQFTYFSESKAGNRTTFGLSCDKLLALAQPAITQFCDQNRNLTNSVVLQLMAELRQLSLSLESRVRNLQAGSGIINVAWSFLGGNLPPASYSTDHDIAQGCIDSGHIPIIMSTMLPAESYGRAARSIGASDVAFYFSRMIGARGQAREYLSKQAMMIDIATLRTKVNIQRCSLPGGEALTFCNSVIAMLDNNIIIPNRKSLPEDCETFDLHSTFLRKLYNLWCQMPNRQEYTEFFERMKQALSAASTGPATTFFYQEGTSNAVYEVLKWFVTTYTGLTKDNMDVELTDKQDDHLQAVLPMIEYLNSSKNPFARDGLFGKVVMNDFHQLALSAYQQHESLMRPEYHEEYCYNSQPSRQPKFDNDQMSKLLWGSVAVAEQAEDKSAKTSALGRFLLEGSTSRQKKSESAQREERLALPMPERYLAITQVAPKPASAPAAAAPSVPAAVASAPRSPVPAAASVAASKGPVFTQPKPPAGSASAAKPPATGAASSNRP